MMRARRQLLRELSLLEPLRFEPTARLLEDGYLRCAMLGGFSPPIPSLLDAAVSSRYAAIAPDQTPLSGAPVAGTLSDLIRALELRAVSGAPAANSMADKQATIISRLPAQGISNVQYGSITLNGATSGTYTISAVDTTKSIVRWLGTANGSGNGSEMWVGLVLTNGTTVTATKGSGTNSVTVQFEVVTYTNILSIQTGTISITAGNLSANATITAVTVGRSSMEYQGSSSTTTNVITDGQASLTLANATTVTATRGASTNSMSINYAVCSF